MMVMFPVGVVGVDALLVESRLGAEDEAIANVA
jgi:hypothetical protein